MVNSDLVDLASLTLAWNGESQYGNYGYMADNMVSAHKKVKAIAKLFDSY